MVYICMICVYCFLITLDNSLRYVNIPRTSSSWSPASEVIGYYCTSERAVLSVPRRLGRYVVSSAEDIAVDESLDKNSQEGKSRESSGQLLACI